MFSIYSFHSQAAIAGTSSSYSQLLSGLFRLARLNPDQAPTALTPASMSHSPGPPSVTLLHLITGHRWHYTCHLLNSSHTMWDRRPLCAPQGYQMTPHWISFTNWARANCNTKLPNNTYPCYPTPSIIR